MNALRRRSGKVRLLHLHPGKIFIYSTIDRAEGY